MSAAAIARRITALRRVTRDRAVRYLTREYLRLSVIPTVEHCLRLAETTPYREYWLGQAEGCLARGESTLSEESP